MLHAQAVSPANTGSMSSLDTGTATIAGQNGPAFVMAASDANLYQIKAAELAVTKAQRDDVKAYARRVKADSQVAQRSLVASLRNDQRTIKAPPSTLSSDRAALLRLLQRSPRGSFAAWPSARSHRSASAGVSRCTPATPLRSAFEACESQDDGWHAARAAKRTEA